MNIFGKKSVEHFKSDAIKNRPEWYIATFDTLNSIARTYDHTSMTNIHNLVHGHLDKKEYNSFMNPFDFKQDRHKSIPGKLRNYDIILKNLRKFIGEYITSYQEFHVISTLPDESNELLDAANELAYKLLSENAVNLMEGGDPSKLNDVGSKVEEFKSRWKDNRVISDHNMLEYLKSVTEDAYLYAKAYMHWITYGCYFMEHRVSHNDVLKKALHPIDCYPIVNDEDFVEDYEGFLHVSMKSLSQIVSDYRDVLEPADIEYLKKIEDCWSSNGGIGDTSRLISNHYKAVEGFSDAKVDVGEFANNISDINCETLYYKGFQEIQTLKYVDPLGNELEKEVAIDYELNPMIGDIELTKDYYPCTYVQYRFGSSRFGVYSKPKKIEVQRQMLNNNAKVKLPITGKVGIFPRFPNHSVVKALYPFQITINLLELAKERAIITSQGKIAIIPKEMLGSNEIEQEEEMYNMLVLKKLFPTTENIPNVGSVVNAIRDIDLSDNDYIRLLSELISMTKESAMDAIDMNRHRSGQVHASDGKATTEEAITQISMGSAVINSVFNLSRCKDYEADIDFSKVAWIDGIKAKFVTSDRQKAYFEVNGRTHADSEFGISVTNAYEYDKQKKAIIDYAFSLGQNGNLDEDVVLEVITNNNISKLKEIVQSASFLRRLKAEQQFNQEQETRKVESDNMLQGKQLEDDNKRYKVDQDNLTKLLVKEADIAIKELDMIQEDRNNDVLKDLESLKSRKQDLQDQINILRRQ